MATQIIIHTGTRVHFRMNTAITENWNEYRSDCTTYLATALCMFRIKMINYYEYISCTYVHSNTYVNLTT